MEKEVGNIPEIVKKVFVELEQRAQEYAKKPRQFTGFKELDRLTTGLANGSLVVLAARPAMGKTSLVVDIARYLEESSEKTTVFFSYEMDEKLFATRILLKSGVGHPYLPNSKITHDEFEKLCESYLKKSRLQVYGDIDFVLRSTVEDMQSICEKTENLGAVIVDYLQLIPSETKGENTLPRSRAMSQISCALKTMAVKLDVPVICTSQLPRDIEYRKDKHPVLEDLRYCGSLTQDADQILFLYRDRYYNHHSSLGEMAECIVAKNRYGDVGTVKLQWDPERCAFSDYVSDAMSPHTSVPTLTVP